MLRSSSFVAAAIGLACVAPALAAAQTPAADPAVVSSIVTPCTGVTEAQRATPLAEDDELACFRAVAAATRSSDATPAGQDAVGLAIRAAIAALRGPDPATPSAPVAAIAAAVDLAVFASCALGAEPNLAACLASTRIAVVVAQDFAPLDADRIAADICLGSGRDSTWQGLVFAVVDELVARAATGTDPVMQGNILAVIEARRTCPMLR